MAAETSYLLRPSDSRHGPKGERLTTEGIVQSARARNQLIATGFGGRAYLLSSTVEPAIQTAEIVGRGLKADVIPSERLLKGSKHWHVVQHLGQFLTECLKEGAGIEADPDVPFIVVAHHPLITVFANYEMPAGVEYGRVHPIPSSKEDPAYNSSMANFHLFRTSA